MQLSALERMRRLLDVPIASLRLREPLTHGGSALNPRAVRSIQSRVSRRIYP